MPPIYYSKMTKRAALIWVHIIGTLLIVTAVGNKAEAQRIEESGDFSVQRLRPSLDHNGILNVEWAQVHPDMLDVNAGMQYVRDPLYVSRHQMDESTPVGSLVRNRMDLDLALAWSTHCCLQLAIGGRFTAFQDRRVANEVEVANLQKSGLGDIFVAGKLQLLSIEQVGYNVAWQTVLSVAGSHHNYLSENGAALTMRLLSSRRFENVRISFNLGGTWREETVFLDANIGSEGLYEFGVAYDIRKTLAFLTTLSGAFALKQPFARGVESPVGVLFGVQTQHGPIQLHVAVGGALNDAYGNPTLRSFVGIRFWYDQGVY